MFSLSALAFLVLEFVQLAQATPLPRSSNSNSTTGIEQLYQFPNQTFVENIAARSNGHLLFTTLTTPTLYTLDPHASAPSEPEIVHVFPSPASATFGIAEYAPDVFAIATGNWSSDALAGQAGSFVVWSVDVSCSSEPARVRKVADVPESSILNGLTTIPGSDYVLMSDSAAGAIWRVQMSTGEVEVVIQDELLTPNDAYPLGVNGILAHEDNNLYFTNSAQGSFGRIPIDAEGYATGEAEVLLSDGSAYDDFDVDAEGYAWVAKHSPSNVVKISLSTGDKEIVGGEDDSAFVESTSATFGRGKGKKGKRLYVATGGTLDPEVPVEERVGGQIVAIDTWKL